MASGRGESNTRAESAGPQREGRSHGSDESRGGEIPRGKDGCLSVLRAFFFFSVKEAARSLTAREMLLEEKRRGTRELP